MYTLKVIEPAKEVMASYKCNDCNTQHSFFVHRILFDSKGYQEQVLVRCSSCNSYSIRDNKLGDIYYKKDNDFVKYFHRFHKREFDEILGNYNIYKLTKTQKELLELNDLYIGDDNEFE